MKTTPDFNSLPPFYKNYVNHVQDMDMLEALRTSAQKLQTLLASIPEEKGTFRYQPEKWSIKELLVHVMDAERIFAYRALRFARKDATPLAGFDENTYVPESNAHSRTLTELGAEAARLRATTIDLFAGFTPEMLGRQGSANQSVISVVNLGYVVAGHEMHHMSILRERYLV